MLNELKRNLVVDIEFCCRLWAEMEGRILAYNYFCQKIVFNMCFDTINKGNIHFTKAYRNSWTLDARVGRWTLDAGPWTLDTELWMLDSGF